ncbi:hypothetical protein CEE36_00575 [candidate division TA06 bacterium B3_TA06]|uniref:Uncharacterized protein n=1 Tax=candidate division TA06 bacterium B3_TA06 TaxID=2012487 RepID=A0A532VAP2_UNCT6|nr:MAG: hypothetical protein CEE36_00575 [candidate division TA06 bacterium B3_TA06]
MESALVISNITLIIVAAILGLLTIRWLISASGIVPKKWKFSWLFYGRDDSELITKTVKKVLNEQKKEEETRSISRFKANWKYNEVYNLIALLSNCIIKTNKEVRYGESSRVWTRYYINSMGIAKNEKALSIMVGIMSQLVNREIVNGQTTYPSYDFIITPKGGNPIFGEKFAETEGAHLILHKHEEDSSKLHEGGKWINLRINFEGFSEIAPPHKKKLRGIAMDCNASGCTQIRESIKEFNKCVKATQAKGYIEPVRDAFILFRPDAKNDKIDDVLEGEGIKLHRIMDFSEEAKTELKALGELTLEKKSDVNKVTQFIKEFPECIKVEHKLLIE